MGRLSAVLANSYVVTHGGSKYVLGTVPRCEIGLHMHAHLQVSSDTCKVDEETLTTEVSAPKPFSVQI